MKSADIFSLISSISKKEKITFVLIGGFAANYHKVSRQTADVDFLIAESDFDKILEELKKEGYKLEYRNEVFAGLSGAKDYIMDLDFMFVEKDTLYKIVKAAKTVNMDRQKFLVPSVQHLIALKLHAIKCNPKTRAFKDLLDIIELIKANKVDIKSADFKELCLKYGSGELYDKITGAF